MLRTTAVGILVVGSFQLLAAQAPSSPYAKEAPFKGRQLEGQVFLCKSDQVASAGYRFDLTKESWIEVVEVSKEKSVTTWRVTLRADRAEVIAFGGATQTLEAPTEFSVRRAQAGILLSRAGEAPAGGGVFAETITIDPATSSFVYTGQNANRFMNKTNTFVGTCVPYI